jgi:hypothetical protein
MTISVQTILDAAYARSLANDPGKLAQDLELIGVLDRRYQFMWALLAAKYPDAMAARAALTALAGAPPATDVPAGVLNILRLENATGKKVWLVPIQDRGKKYVLTPAVYRLGNTLVTLGRAGDPVATDVLTSWHNDSPAALTAIGNSLDTRFHDRWAELLIVMLALYLAVKDETRRPEEVKALAAEFDQLHKIFDAVVGVASSATESPHRAVVELARLAVAK